MAAGVETHFVDISLEGQASVHLSCLRHLGAFPKAIHRLETRLQQLEQHLHTAHADPKEVVETIRI